MAQYTTPAWSNGASPAINAANLLAIGRALEEAQWPYGVCSTGASTTAKTVTIGFSGTFALYAGATVRVKFSNSNTASAPTLNVNSTGAVAMKSYGSTPLTYWAAGQVLTLTYDGTYWVVSGAFSNVKVETGYYTGTGTNGSSNPNSLTFSFAPKFVFIHRAAGSFNNYPYYDGFFAQTDADMTTYGGFNGSIYTNGSDYVCYGQLSCNTMSWYVSGTSASSTAQLNRSGETYYWVAIG